MSCNKVLYGVHSQNIYFITSNIKRDVSISGIKYITDMYNAHSKTKRTVNTKEKYKCSIMDINYFGEQDFLFDDFFTNEFRPPNDKFKDDFNSDFTLGFFVFGEKINYRVISINYSVFGIFEINIFDNIKDAIKDITIAFTPSNCLSIDSYITKKSRKPENTNEFINLIYTLFSTEEFCIIKFPFNILLIMSFIDDISHFKIKHKEIFINQIWEDLIRNTCTPDRLIQWNEDFYDITHQ